MKTIPLNSLVIMVGPCKSSKSTICYNKFPMNEIESNIKVKNELLGNNNRPDIKYELKSYLHNKILVKLSIGERVVIDDNNLFNDERYELAKLGYERNIPVFYIVTNRNINEKINEYPLLKDMIINQEETFKKNEKNILYGDSIAEVIDTRKIDFKVIEKLPTDNIFDHLKKENYSGLTVIPDIHGSLESLKSSINWSKKRNNFMIFLGDIIDYGPKSLQCVEQIYDIVTNKNGVNIIGNHDQKLFRYLTNRVNYDKLNETNKKTVDKVNSLDKTRRDSWIFKFISLYYMSYTHLIINNCVFSHAAVNDKVINKGNIILKGNLRSLVIHGMYDSNDVESTNKPKKIYDWMETLPSGYMIFIGHDIQNTEVPETFIKNNTYVYFMDTGSGKGGYLTTADLKFDDKQFVLSNFNRF